MLDCKNEDNKSYKRYLRELPLHKKNESTKTACQLIQKLKLKQWTINQKLSVDLKMIRIGTFISI